MIPVGEIDNKSDGAPDIIENKYFLGTVKSVFPSGVYVKFADKSKGFIDASEPELIEVFSKMNPSFCEKGCKKIDFTKLLSSGDSVMVKVRKSVDLSNIQLKLIYNADLIETNRIDTSSKIDEQKEIPTTKSPLVEVREKISKVLIIDDEENTLENLKGALKEFRIETGYAKNSEEAIKMMREMNGSKYPLAFVDLFCGNEHGIGICDKLHTVDPEMQLCTISSHVRADIEELIGERQYIIKVLLSKNASKSQIKDFIDDIEKSGVFQEEWELCPTEKLDDFEVLGTEDEPARLIIEELKKIKFTTSINAAAVFAFNPVALSATEKHAYPSNYFEEEPAPGGFYFKYSPIKSVAVDKSEKFIGGYLVEKLDEKFKHLLPLTKNQLRYFCGIPINIGEGHDDDKYGVFFFKNKDNKAMFSDEEITIFKIFANNMGLVLRKFRFGKIIVNNHYIMNLGILDSSIIHDIRTALKLKNKSIDNLIEKINYADLKYVNEHLNELQELSKTFTAIREIVAFYSMELRGDSSRKGDLLEIIKGIKNMIGKSLLEWNIELELIYQDIPEIRFPIAEINQILVNLIINSVEQIREYHMPEDSRKIKIIVRYVEEDLLPVKIELVDNGPGIRRKDINRIFEMGFSTKSQGTGLGLFIISFLVHKLQGKICVKSIRFFETSFLLELPYRNN